MIAFRGYTVFNNLPTTISVRDFGDVPTPPNAEIESGITSTTDESRVTFVCSEGYSLGTITKQQICNKMSGKWTLDRPRNLW